MTVQQHIDISDEARTRVLWKTAVKLQDEFDFSTEEMLAALGDMKRSTLFKGKKSMDVEVSRDVRDRVSMLLRIYTGLRTLFQDHRQATTWIDRPNSLPPFGGIAPRELIVSGDFMALARVMTFIDYWRG